MLRSTWQTYTKRNKNLTGKCPSFKRGGTACGGRFFYFRKKVKSPTKYAELLLSLEMWAPRLTNYEFVIHNRFGDIPHNLFLVRLKWKVLIQTLDDTNEIVGSLLEVLNVVETLDRNFCLILFVSYSIHDCFVNLHNRNNIRLYVLLLSWWRLPASFTFKRLKISYIYIL